MRVVVERLAVEHERVRPLLHGRDAAPQPRGHVLGAREHLPEAVPVLVAVLYKTPYEAAQKFDAYLLRRRAVCCQYLVALLWGNLACWPAVAIAYTKHVNWLNIAVTVLCAFMWFFNLMAFISSKRFVQAHGYYCN